MNKVPFAVLTVLVLFLALVSGSVLMYRLFYALALLPLLSLAVGYLASRQLTGQVKRLTPYLQVGEALEERFTLRNIGFWPKLLLEVEHTTTPPTRGGRVVSLFPRGTAVWTTRTRPQRRGYYTFGTMTITARDPLGFFAWRTQVGTTQRALVYPATVPLPGFHFASGTTSDDGRLTGRVSESSVLAGGVREYLPGDSWRRIHWRSTARTGRFMVKELEHESAGPLSQVWIVLDLWRDVQAGDGPQSTVEYGVTVAASVAKHYLDAGRPVGLVVGGVRRAVVPAATGQAQAARIMEVLALAEPGPEGPLEYTVTATVEQFGPTSTVVLVTPETIAGLAGTHALLRRGGLRVMTVVLDAVSFRQDGGRTSGDRPDIAAGLFVVRRGDKIEHQLDARHQGYLALAGGTVA